MPRLPASGFASRATTRSPRWVAKVWPSISVVVVLPAPPFLERTTMRRDPSIRVRTRWSRASSRRSRLLGPGLTCPPVTAKTLRRHPCRGVRGWARSRNRSVSSSAVRVNTGAVPVAGTDTVAGADEATADAYGIGEAAIAVGWVVGSDPDIGISSGWTRYGVTTVDGRVR